MSKKATGEAAQSPAIINDPLSSGGVKYVERQKKSESSGSFTTNEFENTSITLFPRDKKTEKTPDYGGSVSRGKNDVICDCIFYAKQNKAGSFYMSGMMFLIPDAEKAFIKIDSFNPDETSKPAIVGTVQIKSITYKLALWRKMYEKGTYYNGSIGAVVVG